MKQWQLLSFIPCRLDYVHRWTLIRIEIILFAIVSLDRTKNNGRLKWMTMFFENIQETPSGYSADRLIK